MRAHFGRSRYVSVVHRWIACAVATIAMAAATACGSSGTARSDNTGKLVASARHVGGFAYGIPAAVYQAGRPIAPNPPLLETGAAMKFRSQPALPDGLAIDPATGSITGTPTTVAAAAPYSIVARGAEGLVYGTVHIEVSAVPGGDRHFFVSPDGNDGNEGTLAAPWASVNIAVSRLGPGDTLYLRGGRYFEQVRISGLNGRPDAPITIRSFPGERAILDASNPAFVMDAATAWEPAVGPNAHPDEYQSSFPIDGKWFNRGAFVGEGGYTRLLTYSTIDDLRADNETWAKLAPGDPRPGPAVVTRVRKGQRALAYRFPWTYFGPGIWHHPDTGRVHIRLSHTHNRVPTLSDYAGETDPRKLPLAVAGKSATTLRIGRSSHVAVRDIDVHHGGDRTLVVEGAADIELDRVRVRAATVGVVVSRSARVRMVDSEVDGGIPTWSFRSEFKDNYAYLTREGDASSKRQNNLVRKTQRTLLLIGGASRDTEIVRCNFTNGHDVYVGGVRTNFHHNWIDRIQDEALFVSHEDSIEDLRIHENVISRALSGVSFAGRRPGRSRFLYRNVFDLRRPIAGYRPSGANERSVWRYGHLFKSNAPVGPYFFYQNTALVSRQRGQAAFVQFRPLSRGEGDYDRWILNNVFAAYDVDGPQVAMTFVPHPEYLRQRRPDGTPVFRSNGNLWRPARPSSKLQRQRPMFRCLSLIDGTRCRPQRFAHLADLTRQTDYADERFEADSVTAAPRFRRMDSRGRPRADDDYRLSPSSAARAAGVRLPPGLPDPWAPSRSRRPDIGAFQTGQPPLRVGVYGARLY